VLGGAVAALMLSDALLNRGGYFGVRLGRYVMEPTHPQRLALGVGLLGLFMALLNLAVAWWASSDHWLFYSTFVDIVITMLLFMAVLRFAQQPASAT
jgi:intracellular septation protein A